jgi:HSP20 family protein
MAIVRWDPFRELEEMSDRLNRMIARPSTGTRSGQGKEVMTVADWTPTVDISETESEYAIKAELPEVKKEDVKVTVEDASSPFRVSGNRKRKKRARSTIVSNGRTVGSSGASHFPIRSTRAR